MPQPAVLTSATYCSCPRLQKERRSASQRYGEMKSVAESKIAALEVGCSRSGVRHGATRTHAVIVALLVCCVHM